MRAKCPADCAQESWGKGATPGPHGFRGHVLQVPEGPSGACFRGNRVSPKGPIQVFCTAKTLFQKSFLSDAPKYPIRKGGDERRALLLDVLQNSWLRKCHGYSFQVFSLQARAKWCASQGVCMLLRLFTLYLQPGIGVAHRTTQAESRVSVFLL